MDLLAQKRDDDEDEDGDDGGGFFFCVCVCSSVEWRRREASQTKRMTSGRG